jgi:fructosamine-3-kinase
MEKIISLITEKFYDTTPLNITSLGGGFYGRVFLAKINKEPFDVVFKLYLYNGLAEKEAAQLRTLSKYTIIKIPEVYFFHDADADISNDVLAMEYIDGISIGSMDISLDEKLRIQIAHSIVDNQRSYHNAINREGFGEIDSGVYEKDWTKYYYPKAESTFYNIEEMHKKGKIEDSVLSSARRAFDNFGKIFYLPVEKASLIHADYNTWNTLFDKEITYPKAIIDPFNCCWSDLELDLYQLTHANGNYFGLLDLYKKKFTVSENFEIKNCFYELFTELTHHYNANVDVPVQKVNPYVNALNAQMKIYGF